MDSPSQTIKGDKMKVVSIIVLFLVLVFLPLPLHATMEKYLKDNGGPDRAYDYELKFLPPYCCKVAQNRDLWERERDKWGGVFRSKGESGQDWIHIHHYCFGLVALSRMQRGVGDRNHLLKRAEGEFKYMIEHASPKFILMPEILLKLGQVKLMMGNQAEALRHYYKSIQLKKDYVPAYVQIINYYVLNNNRNEALKFVKMGLKYAPESGVLKGYLARLQ